MTLQEFFSENPKVALAFSGGVDSSYLLYAATNCRAKVRAYYVKSVFQPRFELDDARRLALELGADMKMLDVDVLNDPQITANSADRCYYCKYSIFNAIIKAAAEDAGITSDMTPSDICDKLVVSMTNITIDGLTGEGMTWTADGEPNKAPKAVKIVDGVYTAM